MVWNNIFGEDNAQQLIQRQAIIETYYLWGIMELCSIDIMWISDIFSH